MEGYWWQCEKNALHQSKDFNSVVGCPLVKFFFKLAASGWNQTLLSPSCLTCKEGRMRINYEFPRSIDRVQLAVRHIVGLGADEGPGSYLPMLWEAVSDKEAEPWFDFKYGSRHQNTGAYQNYGLARPAVFGRSELKEVFEKYQRIVGRSVY